MTGALFGILMNVAVSWSGGKDACLAMIMAKRSGLNPIVLVSMIDNNGYSRSNGIPITILQQQANEMNIPIVFAETDWQSYEKNLVTNLKYLKKKLSINGCVFGDIDIIKHKLFEESVCKKVGIKAFLPLWNKPRDWVKLKLIECEIDCYVSVIQKHPPYLKKLIGKKFKAIDAQFLKQNNIDVCGENGEFHTLVYQAASLGLSMKLCKTKVLELENVYLCEFKLNPNGDKSDRL